MCFYWRWYIYIYMQLRCLNPVKVYLLFYDIHNAGVTGITGNSCGASPSRPRRIRH